MIKIKQIAVAIITTVITLCGNSKGYAGEADTALFKSTILKAQRASSNNSQQSLMYAHQALQIGLRINRNDYIGSAYNGLGIIHEIIGNVDSSVYYYEKAVRVFAETDDIYLQNSIKLNLCQQYFEEGRILEAIEMATSAKTVLDSLGAESAMMVARGKLAYLSFQLKDYPQAMRYRLEELELAGKRKDTASILNVTTSLGFMYYLEGKRDSSEFYLNEAKDLLGQYSSITHLLEFKKIEATIAIKDTEYLEAITILMQATELNKNINNDNYQTDIYNYLAEAYIKLGNIDSAGLYCELLQAKFDDLRGYSNRLLRADILYNLANYNVLIGNYKEAYTNLIKHNAELEEFDLLEDKIKTTNFNFEKVLLASKQENELLKLEKESDRSSLQVYKIGGAVLLALLVGLVIIAVRANKRKQEKEEALADLKQIGNIKDGLLEIISHDLRSPLSSLAGLVNLSNQNLLKPEDTKPLFTMLETTMDRSLSLADNLLIWSKLQAGELISVQSETNLKQTIIHTSRIYNSLAISKGIETRLEIDHIQQVMADSFMVSLIIRNIIGLSMANTSNGGSIVIETADKGDEVTVTIVNTLTNLDYGKVNTWKNRAPFGNDIRDKKRTSGLGLYIANQYLLKINSKLVIAQPEDGISYSFALPVI